MNKWMKATVGAAAVATSVVTGTPTNAAGPATEYFIKIDGIGGESVDQKHKGEIDLLSWSWGVTKAVDVGSGVSAGKVSFHDISFHKRVDAASPKLVESLVTGKRIKDATIMVRKSGSAQDYIKITLSDVLVSSVRSAASSGSEPIEEVSVNFAKMTYTYSPMKADGSLGTPVAFSWDVRGGVKY